MKKLTLFIGGCFLSLMFLQKSLAHKVSTYAYREGEKIWGVCYFGDGSPCKNSKVEIYNKKGEKILETLTDEKGEYNLNTKEKEPLKIVVWAGEGHRTEYKLMNNNSEMEAKEKNQTKTNIGITKNLYGKIKEERFLQQEIKKIVEEALESKLQGLKTEIRNLKKEMDKTKLRDIIGGVGYIFGIWGLITIIKRRKNS